MTDDVLLQIKVISRLLHFPDEALIAQIPAYKAALNDQEIRKRFAPVFDYFEMTSLIDLQITYTETFDLKPNNCMNLTYHCFGDSEKRGRELAFLEEIYRMAGLERIDSELPDYLPLVLEFIAEQPDIGREAIIPCCGAAIRILAERFTEAGHPYAVLFDQAICLIDVSACCLEEQLKHTGD